MIKSVAETYVVDPLQKKKIIVVVVRHNDPPDVRWEVFEVTRRTVEASEPANEDDLALRGMFGLGTTMRGPRWTYRTVGMFMRHPELSLQSFNLLTEHAGDVAPGAGPVNTERMLEIGMEIRSLYELIGTRIIPLEWQFGWAKHDPEVRGRVEVWA